MNQETGKAGISSGCVRVEATVRPCPLCAELVDIWCFDDGLAANGTWTIECHGCELELRTYYVHGPKSDKEKMRKLAIKRWNRRA